MGNIIRVVISIVLLYFSYQVGLIPLAIPFIFLYALNRIGNYQTKLELEEKILEEERIRENELQKEKRKQYKREQKLLELKKLLKEKNKENDSSAAYRKEVISPLKKKIKKIELEILHVKASKNPDINLSDHASFNCHYARLKRYGHSKWFGEYEYMGDRGGIYTLTANGNRKYKY